MLLIIVFRGWCSVLCNCNCVRKNYTERNKKLSRIFDFTDNDMFLLCFCVLYKLLPFCHILVYVRIVFSPQLGFYAVEQREVRTFMSFVLMGVSLIQYRAAIGLFKALTSCRRYSWRTTIEDKRTKERGKQWRQYVCLAAFFCLVHCVVYPK